MGSQFDGELEYILTLCVCECNIIFTTHRFVLPIFELLYSVVFIFVFAVFYVNSIHFLQQF